MMPRVLERYDGPTPPPEMGPYKTSSFLLIAAEDASTGNPGPLGRFGLRLLHLRPGIDACRPIMHWLHPQRPPTTSLMFTGDGKNVWSTTEPEAEIPHVTMGNRTGTAILRATANNGQYADIQRGSGVVLRSGMSAAFSLPCPASPPGSPPIADAALPAGLLAIFERESARELPDATRVTFWFLHCTRPSSHPDGPIFVEVPIAHHMENLPRDYFIQTLRGEI